MEFIFTNLTTIAIAIFTGVFLFIISNKLKIPSIALLLVAGIILGPEVTGLINTSQLGKGLQSIISLCVAIILFEGGLTLNPEGYKKAPRIIRRLLTLGVLITWFGTALLIHLLFNFKLSHSLLCGSLVIVTGPTVISPILRNIKIREKLHHILHWESVLIDPIGVFIAILCFEWYNESHEIASYIWVFGLRVLIGISIGLAGGFILNWVLNLRWIPEEQTNIFVLASALFLFGLSDFLVNDSGILTVVISGFVLGWKKPLKLNRIKEFKTEISELAIGVLFILLAANLDLSGFINLGKNGLILIIGVIFIIRPLNIAVCSIKSRLSLREGFLLSWIAPRGVVAASMASLFTLKLKQNGIPNAEFIEIFTYSIIIVTVIIQGSSAKFFVNLLKLNAKKRKAWLIIGAHEFSMQIAEIMEKKSNQKCYFIDSNYDTVNEARERGFDIFQGNALVLETIPDDVVTELNNVLVITDNRDLNLKICEKWGEIVDNLYYWSPNKKINVFGRRIKTQHVWPDLARPFEISFDLKQKNALILAKEANYKGAKNSFKLVPLIQLLEEDTKIITDNTKIEDENLLLFLEYQQ